MPPLAPRFHRCSGALMLLDISGFSSLASQLAKEESLRMGPSSGTSCLILHFFSHVFAIAMQQNPFSNISVCIIIPTMLHSSLY